MQEKERAGSYVWAKEGEEANWEKLRKLLPELGFKVLPRRGECGLADRPEPQDEQG